MEKRFEQDQRERFLRHLAQTQTFVDLKATDVILAASVWPMFESAMGFMGKELGEKMLEFMLSATRQRAAFCQYCDNEIACAMSHPPICEHCDARIDKECDDMDAMIGGES